MPFCRQCGTEVETTAAFCPQCGAVQQPAAPQTPPAGQDFIDQVKNMNNTADTTAAFHPDDIRDNKVMAVLSYFGLLVLIPIFAAKHSRFSQYHANQGLILLIVNAIYSVAYGIISAILGVIPMFGWLLIALIGLAGSVLLFVLFILGVVNAANGAAKELPVIGKYRLLKY